MTKKLVYENLCIAEKIANCAAAKETDNDCRNPAMSNSQTAHTGEWLTTHVRVNTSITRRDTTGQVRVVREAIERIQSKNCALVGRVYLA